MAHGISLKSAADIEMSRRAIDEQVRALVRAFASSGD